MKIWVRKSDDTEDSALKVTVEDDGDVSDLVQAAVSLFVFGPNNAEVKASQVCVLNGEGRLLSNRDMLARHVGFGTFIVQMRDALMTVDWNGGRKGSQALQAAVQTSNRNYLKTRKKSPSTGPVKRQVIPTSQPQPTVLSSPVRAALPLHYPPHPVEPATISPPRINPTVSTPVPMVPIVTSQEAVLQKLSAIWDSLDSADTIGSPLGLKTPEKKPATPRGNNPVGPSYPCKEYKPGWGVSICMNCKLSKASHVDLRGTTPGRRRCRSTSPAPHPSLPPTPIA
eukprot:TRINITY_DN23127_c0_g1_i1.p1 TRINITY_DN23127_c0_g1~~TRINITY_DN23127_c0_g1_i1.p1  ORF type:complete len:283 (+),score=1.89 TRINITY_DN23127_c0_g1_i1:9-857(+)